MAEDQRTSTFTEIRVHGIGDHEYYTSLGLPREKRLNAWVQVAEPPPLPEHQLRIVNWSRSHRRRTGFLWYLAFPFTLVNVAGRMESSAVHRQGSGNGMLRALVFAVGVILTVSQLAWLVVLGETLLRYIPLPPSALNAVPVVAGLLLAGWLLYRYRKVVRRQSERRGQAFIPALVHGVVVVCVALFLVLVRPAQVPWSGWPSAPTPAGTSHLDAMALWIAISISASFLAALALAAHYHAAGTQERQARVPLVAAGILLPVAVLLMHALTALVRMIVDNLLAYVTGLFGLAQRRLHVGILLPYDNPADASDSRLDLFPFLALIAAVAALVAAAVVLGIAKGPGLPPLFRGKAARGRWWHEFTEAAPRLLPFMLPLAVLLAAAGMTTAILLGEGRLGGPWLALAILVLQLFGAAVVLVMLLGQLRPVREVLGKIADIAGFWPVRDHPLAGSSYRDAAVSGISELVSRYSDGVVLVAHSQGSVISAWLLAHGSERNAARERPHLVTAGSPLASLYATFFPAAFSPQLFADVEARTGSWANFWRRTDPVAFPVPGAENRLLLDPRDDGVVRSHSDYWTEPAVMQHIEALSRRPD
ncbi:hypothetical protein BJ994_001360 [Arthrobacter pigmenti]|uniref:Integral membrane protein n=1 Tax=Arthrobacter pigmenti TaxID=271432 RepID=A0A846RPI5_9MICC|nr:hypothetical protein [Arthrobacter pigmenti]NJC22284.1 hypothetical protein [Arthrobacter pigmenti]